MSCTKTERLELFYMVQDTSNKKVISNFRDLYTRCLIFLVCLRNNIWLANSMEMNVNSITGRSLNEVMVSCW